MTPSKRAVLNPKQQSKHSKTGQKASNVFYLGWPLTGAGYLVVVGKNGGGGQGRSRMRLIKCRLRPFNKLWCFHGIRSIKMCSEDRISSKIPSKILDSGKFEHLTVGR